MLLLYYSVFNFWQAAICNMCKCLCSNVEDVVRFPGLPPRRQLTYQVKQLIARETELEKMRRMERAQQKRNPQNVRSMYTECKYMHCKNQCSFNSVGQASIGMTRFSLYFKITV